MKRFKIPLLAPLFSLFFFSCSSSGIRRDMGPNDSTAGPQEVAGPAYSSPGPVGPPEPQEVLGPAPLRRKALVLVFGPGMARSLAGVGVLRALYEEKIPVAGALGTEMGGLVAGVFAQTLNPNQTEWAFQKIKPETFLNKTAILPEGLRRRSSTDRLEKAIKGIFKDQRIENLKIPFRTNYIVIAEQKVLVAEKGPVALALRAATAVQPYYQEASVGGVSAGSAEELYPYLVSQARGLNLGPVVVIDTWPDGNTSKKIRKDALALADLVIRPDLNGVELEDFEKKSQIFFAGHDSVKKMLSEIKKLYEQ